MSNVNSELFGKVLDAIPTCMPSLLSVCLFFMAISIGFVLAVWKFIEIIIYLVNL